MQRFTSVRLVLFEDRVFPGVMEEVVLLLAEGQGPTDHCDLIQAKNVTMLAGTKGQRWTPEDAEDKWMAGLLPADAEAIYAGLRKGDGFSSLQSWGETNLGMVTGNNRYFAFNVETVQQTAPEGRRVDGRFARPDRVTFAGSTSPSAPGKT